MPVSICKFEPEVAVGVYTDGKVHSSDIEGQSFIPVTTAVTSSVPSNSLPRHSASAILSLKMLLESTWLQRVYISEIHGECFIPVTYAVTSSVPSNSLPSLSALAISSLKVLLESTAAVASPCMPLSMQSAAVMGPKAACISKPSDNNGSSLTLREVAILIDDWHSDGLHTFHKAICCYHRRKGGMHLIAITKQRLIIDPVAANTLR